MLGRKTEPSIEHSEGLRGFDAFDLQLGDLMRGERATLGKSLLDVQRELKIKANYIAAIENADPSVFETPGFIAGYVRSYARYLGLDPEWAYDRFCEESGFAGVEGLSGGSVAKTQPRARGEDGFSKSPAPYIPAGSTAFSQIEPGAVGSLLVLAALIGVIGYGGWFVLQEVQRVTFAPVEQSPGLVVDVDTLAGDATQVAELGAAETSGSPSIESFERLYRPQALDAPVLTARDGPIATLDPAIIGALADDPEDRFAAKPQSLEPGGAPAPIPLTLPVQVTETATPDVMLFAVRPAWVRIASAEGTVLFEKILDAGESYTLSDTEFDPVLRAGNSGSLYFNVQGETFGPAGDGTSVIKNVSLGVDAIKDNYQVADIDADPILADVMTAMAQAPTVTNEDAASE